MYFSMDDVIPTFIRRVVGSSYRSIAFASVFLTALAVGVIATQWNINSDFRALLPQTSDAAQAMEAVGERVGSGSALFVVVDSPDPEANKKFARDYAEKLRDLPEVSLAHFHNDKEFYQQHQLLYLNSSDLETLRERLDAKIKEEKKEANPLFASLDSEEDDSGEFIETDDIQAKYDHLAYRDHPEYLISEDRFSLTIIVRFSKSSTDLAATRSLIEEVKAIGQNLDPPSYQPDMSLEYGGGLINRQEDYQTILSDVKSSAIFTLLGLLLVIGLYFRRIRATMLIMVPLVMGVAWTLALAFLLFEELTTVSVFIFAILLGLGIDFSIHLLSGYDHARAEGRDPVDALVTCYQGVGRATAIGAMTTFVTFVVLSFAQFRGLSQFGQVASIGVLATLLAMVVVLPSLILMFQSILPHEAHGSEGGESFEPIVSHEQLTRFVPIAVTGLLAFTVLASFQYDELRFEENFRQLGNITWPWEPEETEERKQRQQTRDQARGTAEYLRARAASVREAIAPESHERRRRQMTTEEKFRSALRGQRSSTPTVLLFDDPEQAREVTHYMRKLNRQGELDTIQSIASVYAFMPGTEAKQKQRLEEIRKIRELLNSEDLSFLEDEQKDRVEEFRQKLDVDPFTIYDLPNWSKRLFKEAGDGAKPPSEGEAFAFEYVIYVNESIDQMKGSKARRFLTQLNRIRDETGADFQIGSQSYIYVQMLDEIKRDGPLMIGIALCFVLLILSLAFRSPLRGLVAMAPCLLGLSWLFGAMVAVGLKVDFFNVIIIPVVIGIGVDAGVHFYSRYLEYGRDSAGRVLRTVGSAVVMASITSGIGFGGLAITEHGGLKSIGQLAIIGIGTTMIANLLVMPLVFWTARTYDFEWLLPRESDRRDDAPR